MAQQPLFDGIDDRIARDREEGGDERLLLLPTEKGGAQILRPHLARFEYSPVTPLMHRLGMEIP